MKTEIIKNNNVQDIKYPCLMINEDYGLIVLAVRNSRKDFFEGSLLSKTKTYLRVEIGEYDDSWILKNFKSFTDKLVLSNEE